MSVVLPEARIGDRGEDCDRFSAGMPRGRMRTHAPSGRLGKPETTNDGRDCHERLLQGDRPRALQGAGQRRPAGLPLLREGPDGARQADARAPAHGGRLLALVRLAGRRSLRRADLRAAVVQRGDERGGAQGRGRLRDVRDPRGGLLLLPRPRHRAGGQEPRRERSQRPGDRRHLRAEDGGDRSRLAVGDGQPVLQPPLHGRGGDQSGPGGVCLRGGAGEELPRRHA